MAAIVTVKVAAVQCPSDLGEIEVNTRRLTKLIETHYPGTKLAINEYDTGSREHYHGALIRAAALGIFMQENLYMAQNWHQTDDTKFIYFAQKLYGNYDGASFHNQLTTVALDSSAQLAWRWVSDSGEAVMVKQSNGPWAFMRRDKLPSQLKYKDGNFRTDWQGAGN